MGSKIEPSHDLYETFGLAGRNAPFGLPASTASPIEQGQDTTYGTRADRRRHIRPDDIPLQTPSNRTTSTNMTVAREEIDAKLAASEARTEARFAEMNGKFDLMLSKMDALSQSLTQSLATVQEAQGELKKEMGTVRQDAKEEARHTRHTLWAVAAIIVAIIGVAVTVWLGGLDLGTKVSDLVDQKVASIQPAAEAPPAPPQQ